MPCISNTKNSQQIFAQLDYQIPKTIKQISDLPNNIILIDGIADPKSRYNFKNK